MSHYTESARKAAPKKPLNAYFKYRQEKLVQFKDDEDKVAKCKKAWNQLDEKVKEKMEKKYKEELEEYKEALEKWKKKFGLDTEDLRAINKENKKENAVEKSKGNKSMPKDKSAEKRKSEKKGNSKEEEKGVSK